MAILFIWFIHILILVMRVTLETINVRTKKMKGNIRHQTMIANYINEVLRRFSKGNGSITEDITDRVFLMIQSNPQLHQEYKGLIDDGTSKHGLNARIGKRVREHFCLQNIGRCNNPKSCLIQSYERHSK